MRLGKRAVAVAGVAGLSVLLGAGVAMAAASGAVTLSVSGARIDSGRYQYVVARV
jgi:outer membrane lipoprotein SlyB